jgi:hypothetical protein
MNDSTPMFDAWRADAQRHLAPRGRKAELARHLTARYGREQRSWERHISAVLAGDLVPNAELLLAMDAWFAAPDGAAIPPRKTRTARRPK